MSKLKIKRRSYPAAFSLLLALIGFHIEIFSQSTPNVLVILTDDQGTLDLNCYGSEDLHTPHLDRLAKSGIRFTQFYAGAPVCSPSRASLLTGKSNLRAGVPGNVPVPEYAEEKGKYGIPADQKTMADLFKAQGYQTSLIGKWHLGHQSYNVPNAMGFDYFFGHQRGCIDNYSHTFFWQGPNLHDLYRNQKEVFYPGQHFLELMSDEVIRIVERDKPEPFFIYWAINAPHYPYQGSQRWRDHYKELPMPRREYAAFLSTIDKQVGQVMDALVAAGKEENTIIVFQSDHGHSTEERAFWGGGNAGPYRGCKFSLFEGGLRVPAVISYPGTIAPNQERNQICQSADWLPTLLDLAGLPTENGLDGRSLSEVINYPEALSPHKTLQFQVGSYDDQESQWAVRSGNWKLLGNPKDPTLGHRDVLAPLYLVDLSQDPSESTNLIDDFPEKAADLKKLHDQWLIDVKKEMKL